VMTDVDLDFAGRTEPYRRELLAHCYRMLGSVHDAEDLVQDTMLRAWRAFDGYDPARASLRTWLYRIATNACLTALAGRARRPLPAGLGTPSYDPGDPFAPGFEVPWLQPIPDAMLVGAVTVPAGPAAPVGFAAAREPASVGGLRLAIVAALQLLPPRQRAVLILRDVLDLSAAEVAQVLDMTLVAVNSALQRARTRLREVGPREEDICEPAAARAMVDRYVAAFESADLAALKRLLTDDAVLEMPPYLNWMVGAEDYTRFIARAFAIRGTDWRTVPVGANGQPAVAAYVRNAEGVYALHTLQVFTATERGISRNTTYQDPVVFGLFDLAPTL
jgi:RNA polymerase sigma-70 factor, ECF subfamily